METRFLSTTLAVLHKFWYYIFIFIHFRIFLIFSLVYFSALRLLRVLFAFQYLRIFSRNFLVVRGFQINSLWSENIFCIISVFLDILGFILWAILMNVLCLLKRNGIFCCWGIVPYKCQVSQHCWYCGSNKSSVSLLIFV